MICNRCGASFNSPFCPNCGMSAALQEQQNSTPNIPPQMQPVWKSFHQPQKKMNGCLLAIIITVGSVFFLGILFSILIALFSVNNGDTSSYKESISVTEVPIKYTAYDVSELMNDLNSNALKAEKKYTDQYIELTGRLGNIDSDGKYISLIPSDNEYAFLGVQCYIKSDEQTDKVLEMTTGDAVTLKGKIKSIGEVMGYSLDIIEIE